MYPLSTLFPNTLYIQDVRFLCQIWKKKKTNIFLFAFHGKPPEDKDISSRHYKIGLIAHLIAL